MDKDKRLAITEEQEEMDLMNEIREHHGSMFYTSYSDYEALIRMELSSLHNRQMRRREHRAIIGGSNV